MRSHVANVVQQYLEEVDIAVMEWPAQSPDLNPIEHVWDLIGRAVRSRNMTFHTLRELSDAVTEEWDNIPQEVVQNLIASMPERMQCVIRARGGNTRY